MENKDVFRIRNKQISFRVTEYELALIRQRAKESGKKTLNNGNRIAYHMIQSFSIEDDITLEKAHDWEWNLRKK